MLLRYCPPTSYSASVICPSEHTFAVSISASNVFPLWSAASRRASRAAGLAAWFRALNEPRATAQRRDGKGSGKRPEEPDKGRAPGGCRERFTWLAHPDPLWVRSRC